MPTLETVCNQSGENRVMLAKHEMRLNDFDRLLAGTENDIGIQATVKIIKREISITKYVCIGVLGTILVDTIGIIELVKAVIL